MKTKSTLLSMLFAAVTFAMFSNCSGKKEDAHHEHDHEEHAEGESADAMETSEPQYAVDGNFQQQLAGVFTSYVSLKDAFVSSDASKVKAEASNTAKALQNVDMKLLSGAAHNDWMNHQNGLQSSLKAIQASDDIEEQREAFSDLSDNLYKSIKAFGLGGSIAYYEYCPMAFNDQGGYWLSDEEKIRNPYFGNKMLTCGEVREKLK